MNKVICFYCRQEIDTVGKGKVLILDGEPWHRVCFDTYGRWLKVLLTMIGVKR